MGRFSKKSSIKSHLTVHSYVELLSNLLVLFPVYFKDVSQDKILYRKNKKIYFYDSFILDVFIRKLNLKVDFSQIVEGIVGSHLKRDSLLEEISFTQVKKETDFALRDKGIEVKYQNKVEKEDFRNRQFFKDYLVLSKEEFGQRVVPVHVYLFVK